MSDNQHQKSLLDKVDKVDWSKVDWHSDVTLVERANQLPLPFGEAMRLVQYAEHTTEDKLRMAYVNNGVLTKEQVIKILLEEIEFNFEKHILPQLAS